MDHKDVEYLKTGALGKLDSIVISPLVADTQYKFLISQNEHLSKELRSVSIEKFVFIIGRMRDGLLAAMKCRVDGKLVGVGAIPNDVAWVSGIIQGESESKIGYQKDGDRILVTARGIAELIDASNKGMGYHYDKLGGSIVRAEDPALLLMAEEASHRYDIQVRHLEFTDTSKTRDNVVEKNAEQFVQQVVDLLSIPVFS